MWYKLISIYIYIHIYNIHRGKLTAATWKSPTWKGKSSEPNLHSWVQNVNLPWRIYTKSDGKIRRPNFLPFWLAARCCLVIAGAVFSHFPWTAKTPRGAWLLKMASIVKSVSKLLRCLWALPELFSRKIWGYSPKIRGLLRDNDG